MSVRARKDEELLDYSYNSGLVLASIALSMMAAFTGLSVTRGLSRLSVGQRQTRIVMGAVALGGGIWSMHFIAMLAVRLPIAVAYDVLATIASLLIAILLAGVALLLMHFTKRNLSHIFLSGTVLGAGIVAMHYLGMSGIEFCRPVYAPSSIFAAGLAALAMGVAAIWASYGRRTRANILIGTLIFGSSVVIVHFTAMAGTGFLALATSPAFTPALDNNQLALIVMVSAFVICGAFLLSGATFLAVPAENQTAPAGADSVEPDMPEPSPEPAPLRIPVERGGQTQFLPAAEVSALRAEGHYTIAYSGKDKFFCPWSISEAERRLVAAGPFFRVHRSYLVNIARVTGFERRRDSGICLFEGTASLDRVPVSRNRIPALRDALGL
ncbi:MHYT domain-containing protein [Ostreiculturibacter nitratireducens]|uniref:MHYT domain-containing protein n=1 Tax=Ostreiculturibacter nitratireducens TaxID=3075226 RepID=UPI0031B59FB2